MASASGLCLPLLACAASAACFAVHSPAPASRHTALRVGGRGVRDLAAGRATPTVVGDSPSVAFSSGAVGLCGAALALIGLRSLAERRRGGTAMRVTKHWWLKTSTGFDAKTTKRGGGRNEQGCAHRIKDWQRRESRRRGEEDFRHDVDNFELMTTNLIRAPGDIHVSHTKAYCRSKFGHRGRSAGKGRKGAGVRGRRTMHPNWEGGGKFPYHLRMPKISLEERRRFKHDGYERITFSSLNLLSDGEEAEFQDLRMRGLMVMEQGRMREWIQHDVKTKVVCKDESEALTAKDLKVYAHKFDPLAREKIEANGGQCIRLDEETHLPIEAEYVKIDNLFD